jgi:hypothetical protein
MTPMPLGLSGESKGTLRGALIISAISIRQDRQEGDWGKLHSILGGNPSCMITLLRAPKADFARFVNVAEEQVRAAFRASLFVDGDGAWNSRN